MRTNKKRGVTLVELLVVIAIIGVLVGLLLPAVQSARESARRIACGNNLRQIALASAQHQSQHGFFPSGGWGWFWTGDPNRGFGKGQPGSWAYSLLPNLEYNEVFQLGGDGQPDVITPEQLASVARAAAMPVTVFICPSRRSPNSYPVNYGPSMPWSNPSVFQNAKPYSQGSRSDYAANAGSVRMQWGTGPTSWDAALAGAFGNMTVSNGVSHQRSQVRPADITDGLSKTYLLGEKYLDPNLYGTGFSIGDDHSMLVGDDLDMHRWTFARPLQDTRGFNGFVEFGSAHPLVYWMAFADGSVRLVDYGVDGTVHALAGSRNDGQVTDSP